MPVRHASAKRPANRCAPPASHQTAASRGRAGRAGVSDPAQPVQSEAPTDALSVGSTIGTDQDFATTLRDGRRVIGRLEGSEWSIHVYSSARQSRLLGYGVAATRPDALERAGLSGEDAGEVLGRIGI